MTSIRTDSPMENSAPPLARKGLREFGLTSGAVVAGLFGLLLPWLFGHQMPVWPWPVAGVLCVWALTAPSSLRPVYRGWMAIGHVLGIVNTRIVLAILFFVVFVPVALVFKVARHDPMARAIDKRTATYRTPSRPRGTDHMERPF